MHCIGSGKCFPDTKSICIHILPLLGLILVCIFVLWPGLQGPLILDDFPNLSPLLHGETDYAAVIFENQAGPFGRSVTMASFVINHWLQGELVPFDLKLTNLLIHLVNGILVYYFLFVLLRNIFSTARASLLAILVSGFWILNPVNTETVFYTIQRATLLAAMFMLAACILYVYLRTSFRKTALQKTLIQSLLFVFWTLAMLSKENAVLLPLFILSIEVCFFDYIDIGKFRMQQIFLYFLLPGLSLIVLFCLVITNAGLLDYINRGFSLEQRLFTQPVVLVEYMKEMLFPYSAESGLYRDDFTIRDKFWNTATIASICFIGMLIVAGFFNLRNSATKYLSSGVFMFFSGHLLESTIFPLEMFFWHRNYFPSIGVFLSLVLILDWLVSSDLMRRLLIVTSICYCFLLAQQSLTQAKIWSSYDLILMNAYKNHPESIRVSLEITGVLVEQREYLSALAVNKAIIAARPQLSLPAKIQRLYIYCELGKNMPEQEYDLFETDLNMQRPLLLSSALNKLLQSYRHRSCDSVNIRKIVNIFTVWTDAQFSSAAQTAGQLWSIDYYMIEFLLLFGEDALAHERLNTHIRLGNDKAAYFKAHVMR